METNTSPRVTKSPVPREEGLNESVCAVERREKRGSASREQRVVDPNSKPWTRWRMEHPRHEPQGLCSVPEELKVRVEVRPLHVPPREGEVQACGNRHDGLAHAADHRRESRGLAYRADLERSLDSAR